MSNISSVLSQIQTKLAAPKGRKNEFGNYCYRNCEDIFCALKPLLAENGASVVVSDDLVLIGDRYYIKATARLLCGGAELSSSAFAREALDKKGMDLAQVTGAASSYARKYALAALFAIDGEADPDARDNREPQPVAKAQQRKQPKASDARTVLLQTIDRLKAAGVDPVAIKECVSDATNGTPWKELTDEQMTSVESDLRKVFGK